MLFAKLHGQGRVWIWSLPFSRLAGHIYAAGPAKSGGKVGEGSILGDIGDMLDGDYSEAID